MKIVYLQIQWPFWKQNVSVVYYPETKEKRMSVMSEGQIILKNSANF